MDVNSRSDQAGRRILGIDPGLNITGYGIIQIGAGVIRVVEAGVIRSTASHSLEARLAALHDGMEEVIEAFGPQTVALEELYAHYERPRTAILMGHARGVLCLAAARARLPVFHYSATQVKSVLTGNGRAPKAQMQIAVTRQLGLPQVPEPADVADALAVAICHSFLQRQEINSP